MAVNTSISPHTKISQMKRVLSSILLIVSLFFYYFAPDYYSFGYCIWAHNLFLTSAAFVLLSDIHNEKVGFNLLFSISFFFTNFVYPVYIYPIDPHYSLFSFPFNESVISKCTGLAQVAYAAYACGYLWKIHKKRLSRHSINFSVSSKQIRALTIFVLLYFLVFLLFDGLEYFEDRYERGEMSTNMTVQYLMLFFPSIIIFFSSIILLCKRKRQATYIYGILSIIALILLSSGTRTFPLLIFSCLFIIYCLRNKVSLSFVIPCIIVGILLMSFVGDIRHEGILTSNQFIKESSEFGFWDHFSDLFINNRNLYVFYDFVENNTNTYGLTMISSLLSPIPFAQNIFLNLTGLPYYVLGSASLSTFLTLGDPPEFGLGTNIVGDVYLAFGLIGVLIFFYALGRFIIHARELAFNGSYPYMIIYLALASDAIYMCRASYFDALRIILWTIFFVLTMKQISNKKVIS